MRNPLDRNQPVVVLVTEGRYDIVDSPTPRNIALAAMLMSMGGVNESVKPGTYYFNVVEDKETGQWIVSLNPA